MKKRTKTIGGRILALALITLMLLGTLVGCANKASTVVVPTIETDAFLGLDEKEAMTLKQIAVMLTDDSVYTKTHSSYNTREMLVAAYRGYDMLSPGFDDNVIDPEVAGDPNVSAIIHLIETANAQADSDVKLLSTEYQSITADQALRLINSMKTPAQLEGTAGFIDKLLCWIGAALGWITELVGGYYIIGICIFAIVVEILMLPLSIKQHKSSIKQAKLKPKEMAIRKKYAGRDDQATRQKLSAEIQELYQKENVNAASGCLPLLVQMPIILALYRIVVDPLHYVLGQASGMSTALNLYYTTARAAGGMGHTVKQASNGTISLLSQIGERIDGLKSFMLLDNGENVYEQIMESGYQNLKFAIGKLDLGATPSLSNFNILLLVPVLTFVVYFFSMRLTKKFTYQPANPMAEGNDRQAACSGWMMDITMPLMSVYITFIVPALIGVYWIFKSIISTLSRFIITRIMPYPKFTEEDYREAEREYAGKAARKSEPGQYSYGRDTKMVGGKPKSLFHMDDDDYVAKVEEQERKEAEEKGASDPAPVADQRLEGATLKKDDRPAKKEKKNKKDDQ